MKIVFHYVNECTHRALYRASLLNFARLFSFSQIQSMVIYGIEIFYNVNRGAVK